MVLKPSLYTALLIIQCISRTMLFQDTQIGYNRLRITFGAFTIHTEKKSSLMRKPSPFTSKRKGNYERTDQDLGSLLQFAGAHPICWFSLSYISILSSNIMSAERIIDQILLTGQKEPEGIGSVSICTSDDIQIPQSYFRAVQNPEAHIAMFLATKKKN